MTDQLLQYLPALGPGEHLWEQYRLLVENMADAVFIADLAGNFRFANSAMESSTGYPRERLLAMNVRDLVAPEHLPLVEKALARRIQGEEIPPYEFEVLIASGARVPVEIRTSPIYNATGQLVALQGIALDLTERRQAQEQERRYREGLEALTRTFGTLALERDFDPLCRRAVEEGRRALGFDRMSLWFEVEGSQEVMGSFGTDEQGNLRDERACRLQVSPGSPMGQVLHQRESVVLEENAALRNHRAETVGTGGVAFVPLASEGTVLGCACADNLLSGRPIEAHQVELLRLYGATVGQLCQRVRAEEALQALSRLSLRLAGAASVAAIAAVVWEETERLLGWEAYYFAVRRPDHDIFEVAEFVDIVAGQKQLLPRVEWSAADLSPTTRPVLEGQPVLINRAPGQEEPVLDRFGDKDRPSASLMFVPVRREGTTIGILSAQSYTPWRYSEADLNLLQQVADAVAPALERAHAEEARQESEERYRLLFEQSPVGVLHYDSQLRVTDCNERFIEILQSARERLIGLDVNSLQDHSVLPAIRQALEGSIGFYEGPYRATTSSAEVWVALRTAPLRDAQGHIQGGVGLVEDLTERRQLEEQLRQAQKMEAIGTLAGGIAHDFNNLLTGILGNLELAGLRAPEELRPYLQSASQTGQRAADLVQQLLLFARKSRTERHSLHLGPLLKETVQLLRQTIDLRIEVQARVAPDLWPIYADGGQMHQVLMNLAVNARDAILDCLEGRVEKPGRAPGYPFSLTLAAENVTIGEDYGREHLEGRAGEFVRVSVSDDGAGMDPETRQRIFEPFFTTKQIGRGTGLGLATVYGIVKQHEGWINVYSEPGQGTTVRVYLPRHATGDEEAAEGTKARKLPGGTETILLVDDQDIVRGVGEALLEHLGYTVLIARDGLEGIEIYARERERIDLVVMDLTMPRMSGMEALPLLRLLNPTAQVLISSGHDEETYAPECRRLGAVGFVAKPYRIATMAQAVRTALDQAAT